MQKKVDEKQDVRPLLPQNSEPSGSAELVEDSGFYSGYSGNQVLLHLFFVPLNAAVIESTVNTSEQTDG